MIANGFELAPLRATSSKRVDEQIYSVLRDHGGALPRPLLVAKVARLQHYERGRYVYWHSLVFSRVFDLIQCGRLSQKGRIVEGGVA